MSEQPSAEELRKGPTIRKMRDAHAARCPGRLGDIDHDCNCGQTARVVRAHLAAHGKPCAVSDQGGTE